MENDIPLPELVLAKALYQCAHVEPAEPPTVPWENTTEQLRDKYLAVAKAALARETGLT